MTDFERKKPGFFKSLWNIDWELSLPRSLSELGSAPSQPKPEHQIIRVSRRELIMWTVGTLTPLAAIVYQANQIDVTWDGRPKFPPTPTPLLKPTPHSIPPKGAAEGILPVPLITSSSRDSLLSQKRKNDPYR
jgi:hypothetical protein